MLNGFCWVFIVLLFLKIVLLQVLNHLLTTLTKLAIELYHRHVLNSQIISTSALCILPALLLLLLHFLAFLSCSRHCSCHSHLLFRFLFHLKLLFHDVSLNLTQFIAC